jgi:hypothetical protein
MILTGADAGLCQGLHVGRDGLCTLLLHLGRVVASNCLYVCLYACVCGGTSSRVLLYAVAKPRVGAMYNYAGVCGVCMGSCVNGDEHAVVGPCLRHPFGFLAAQNTRGQGPCAVVCWVCGRSRSVLYVCWLVPDNGASWKCLVMVHDGKLCRVRGCNGSKAGVPSGLYYVYPYGVRSASCITSSRLSAYALPGPVLSHSGGQWCDQAAFVHNMHTHNTCTWKRYAWDLRLATAERMRNCVCCALTSRQSYMGICAWDMVVGAVV